MADFENPPQKILVRLYKGERLSLMVRYQWTHRGEMMALSEAEEFVGCNPTRTAHLHLEPSEKGLYIVRPCPINDDRVPTSFCERVQILSEKLNAMR